MNRKNLIDTLVRHEGLRHKPYEDTTGHISIGVGRNLDGMGLSDDEIFYMLQNDITRCERELTNAFPWYSHLNSPRQEAMINLAFNLGIPRLRGFRNAIRAMAVKDFEEAADHFLDSKWAKQVGKRAFEVTYMIRTGEYLPK